MKSKKTLLIAMSVALVLAIAIGGTLAFLQDVSNPVENKFNDNKVTVALAETTGGDYEIVPGATVDKDPKVTVNNTLDAYAFVKVKDETGNKVNWTIADGWTLLDGTGTPANPDKVYYRLVTKNADPKTFDVLKDNKVSFNSTLTNASATDVDEKLTFTAYAIQRLLKSDGDTAYLFTPKGAWSVASAGDGAADDTAAAAAIAAAATTAEGDAALHEIVTTNSVDAAGAITLTDQNTPLNDNTKQTTVAITDLDGVQQGDSVQLNVTVEDINQAPSDTAFQVAANHTAVAAISLELKDASGTNVTFDGGTATITTYIVPGLDPAEISVVYNGAGDAPTFVSYDPATGMLVFTTTHFSQFYVDYKGSFAYLPQTDSAYTGNDPGGDVIDAARIYAEGQTDLSKLKLTELKAMAEEEWFGMTDEHAIICTFLIGGCNGYKPTYVDPGMMDYFAEGTTQDEVLEIMGDYFDAYKDCVESVVFYPQGSGQPGGWNPWPVGIENADL